jgi:hypothetical protein
MPRKSKTDQEQGWMRSIWGEFDEIGRDYAARAKIEIVPTVHRGVFHVTISATVPDPDGGQVGRTFATQLRYPTAENVLFLPWLWNQARKIGEWVVNEHEVTKAPQQE